MTLLLYYSYSKNLTEEDITQIDEKVYRNRKLIYQFIIKLPSNTKRKTREVVFIVCLGLVFQFSIIEPVEAMGMVALPRAIEHRAVNQNVYKLVKPRYVNIPPNIEPKVIAPELVRVKHDLNLKQSRWIKELGYRIRMRGGEDKHEKDIKLIRSIISKATSEATKMEWNSISINKIVMNVGKLTLEIATNPDVWRLIAEIQKQNPGAQCYVDGFTQGLSPHRPILQGSHSSRELVPINENRRLNPSAHYGTRNISNISHPRTTSESFKTKSIERLTKQALKNDAVRREYKTLKNQIEKKGTHPAAIGSSSTYVSDDIVLVKKDKGRYLVKVSEDHVNILGVGARNNQKNMGDFQTHLNEAYNLKLTGYNKK